MNILQLISFLFGQIGMMALTRYFFQWMIDFSSVKPSNIELGTEALFSASMIGMVLLGFRVFDGITDPIAGHWCDQWVREGKSRADLLKYTAILPCLGLVLCFMPSFEQAIWLRWLILLIGLFIFFVGYTVYAIPYWSLIADYSKNDLKLEGILSNLLGLGLLLATVIGFVISPMLVQAFDFFGGAVVLSSFCLLLMLFPYFGRPKSIENKSMLQSNPGLGTLMSTFKHQRFLATALLFAGSQMSFTMMTSASPLIAVDLFSGSRADVKLILGPLLFVALLFVLIFAITPILNRFSIEKLLLGASLMLALIYGISAGLPFSPASSLNMPPIQQAMILFSLAGPFVAILLSLEGQVITGCAKEAQGEQTGIYFGSFNLMIKLFNGIAIAIAGFLGEYARSTGNPIYIKAMNVCAGLFLLLGVGIYLLLNRSISSKG
jgi:GPH family glycoside/pentoside/hexuronide:cation symporter